MTKKSNKPPFQVEEPLPCLRCDSKSTRFCYYNNHRLSQPRLFCRDCLRHWTLDGALRDVPVGGGTHGYKYLDPCRFSKRIRSFSVTINNDEEEDTNEGNNVISCHGSGDEEAFGSGGVS